MNRNYQSPVLFASSPTIGEFISKINRLATRHIPFLFIIDFDMNTPEVHPLDELPDDIRFQIHPPDYQASLQVPPRFEFQFTPPDRETYRNAYWRVQQEIQNGNTYLLNLTFRSRVETTLTLDEIFEFSRARYKLLYKNRFVVFSPETFVEISSGKISSFPMKGTIDASLPDARERLLNDPKELAEHYTIVDLIRNDLAMVAEDVTVTSFRQIDKIFTHRGELLQMSSHITGKLPENYRESLGEILITLLPAGSITGAPKKKTVEIIRSVENYTRGYYTGIFGVDDGQTLISAVMIRFIENENGSLWFKSGGGITSMSDPDKEYEELIRKIYVPIS